MYFRGSDPDPVYLAGRKPIFFILIRRSNTDTVILEGRIRSRVTPTHEYHLNRTNAVG